MTLKKIEDLDYYEILNINSKASLEEIEEAYLYGIASYHPDSLASYGLLEENEKKAALTKIEEAYKTLSHPKKRRQYDLTLFDKKNGFQEKAYFRKSTTKLEIEDGTTRKIGLWARVKSVFSFFMKKESSETENIKKPKETQFASRNNHALYSGEHLKKVRETQGKSLEEISKKSKINISLLKAVEEENFEQLPQGVYTANLIKHYAYHLGLNPKNSES